MFIKSKNESVIVGKPFQLDAQCTVYRSPAGSEAEVDNKSGMLTCDKSGIFIVDRYTEKMKLVAWPPESLAAVSARAGSYTGHTRSHDEALGILRAIGREMSNEDADALTATKPLPPLPRGLQPFGGDHGQ